MSINIVEDIATHPYWASYRDFALVHGLRACWSTPILTPAREVLGTFAMYYREPRGPQSREKAWVATATHLAAIAIGHHRGLQAIQEREQRLYLLHELNEILGRFGTPSELLDGALVLLVAGLGVDRAFFADIREDGSVRWLGQHHASLRPPSDIIDQVSVWWTNRIASMFHAGERSMIITDARSDPVSEGAGALLQQGAQAVLCEMVTRDDGMAAAMVVGQSKPRVWSAGERSLVREFTQRCWTGLLHRRAEADLERSQALVRLAGRAARLGGWRMELASQRLVWSDEILAHYRGVLGFSPTLDEALSCVASEARERLRERIVACSREGTRFEVEVPSALAGPPMWMRVIGRAERDRSGRIVALVGAIQDVTDRHRLEEQLRQTQKMDAIGSLAGGIAHDFNNILSVIISYSSLILEDLRAGDPLRAEIDEILRAGRRGTGLTSQLLAFSRRQIIQPRVLDMGQVVTGMEPMLKRMLGEDIELSVINSRSLGRVTADPSQLEQVVMNLAVNAREAMPSGGRLTIETSNAELDAAYAAQHVQVSPGSYVMLAITDTGGGIEPAIRDRVFEPFFTTKERGRGTGLGLSTVFGIVKQNEGHIWLYSEPGRGTTFRVYLPRTDRPADSLTATAALTPVGGSETILLVEDEDQVRVVVRSVLRRNGYNVLDAQNGGEACLISERYQAKIHLLLTDVVMPRMSGRELADRIHRARPEMRVLYVSGYTENSIVHHGVLDAGISFLAKPITPNSLLGRVREVLDET